MRLQARAAVSVATLEGPRLLKHPAVLIGAALAASGIILSLFGWAPVLDRISGLLSVSMSLLAAGALIATSDLTRRLMNTAEHDPEEVAPLWKRRRILGAVSASSYLMAGALAFQFCAILVAAIFKPVGRLIFRELLLGTAVVAFGSALGILIGSRSRARYPALLVLITLVGLNVALATPAVSEFAAASGSEAPVDLTRLERAPLFAPVASFDLERSYPMQKRQPGAQAAYLLAMTAAVVMLSYLKHVRKKLPYIASVLLVVALGVAPVTVAEAEIGSAGYDSDCVQLEVAEYCFLVPFEGWVEEWSDVVLAVRSALPMGSFRDLRVEQVDTRLFGTGFAHYADGTLAPTTGVKVSTWWALRVPLTAPDDLGEFHLGLAVASRSLGLPVEYVWAQTRAGERIVEVDFTKLETLQPIACRAPDQARAVAALWAAATISDQAERFLRNGVESPGRIPLFGDQITPELAIYEFPRPYVGKHMLVDRLLMSGERFPWYAIEFYLRDAYYATQLLNRPFDEVSEFLSVNWDWVSDPSTTTNQLAREVGIAVEKTPIDLPSGEVDRSFYGEPQCGSGEGT